MFHVLVYDVTHSGRRARFHKRLKAHLVPCQKSVFEGRLTPAALARVEVLIPEVLDLQVDAVRTYALCAACRGLTRTWGASTPLVDETAPVLL